MKTPWLFFLVLLLATFARAQTRISGTAQCGKPQQQLSIEVGDRPNHSFAISKSTCTWTKPLEIAGAKSKEDVITSFSEIDGTSARDRGYVVQTLESGDKVFVAFEGTATLKDGTSEPKGKWHFSQGTGKLKGIKGQGTYKGKGGAQGVVYEVEGDYRLSK